MCIFAYREQYINLFRERIQNIPDWDLSVPLEWEHSLEELQWDNPNKNVNWDDFGSYPIVMEDAQGMKRVFYVSESGNLQAENRPDLPFIWWSNSNIHYLRNQSDKYEIIDSTTNYAYIYDIELSEVQIWSFETMICNHPVNKGTMFVGKNPYMGYLFRDGTDVYLLKDIGIYDFSNDSGCSLELIAQNVQYVVDACYADTSDAFCQPLFLMNDGGLKYYFANELRAPWYEGGGRYK